MKRKLTIEKTLNAWSALSFLFLLLTGGYAFGQTTETYTSGTSWTVPCGVTSIDVEVYGAGGGGGGSKTGGQAGGGGGAGGYAFITLAVTPGQVITYSIGTGGAGAAAGTGADGTAGNPTTFNAGAVTANGGTAGLGDNNGGAGGTGGTATGGDTNSSGGNGGPGGASIGGSGGSNPGPNGGGNTPGGAAGINGSPGNSYGGGGAGGGDKSGGSNPSGGAGADGAIVITYTSTVTQPDAGSDQNSCTLANLSANTPDAGWTGTWTVVSGTATIGNANDPNSSISGVPAGTCATLRWTFSQAGCLDMTDDVIICSPQVCNDDPCNATAISVGTSCSYTSYNSTGATVSTGMFEPACGSFSAINSEDVWYSITVPANGTVTVQAVDDGATAGSFYPGIAIYSGPCNDLMHQGCAQTTSTLTPSVINFTGTPGETIYVRVWDYQDNMGGFNLCAFTHANAAADILTGDNTISCGSSYTFTDPQGAAGDYLVEQTATYTICPDAAGQYVSVNFTAFDLYNLDDYLTVMDGGGTFDSIIGNYTGTTSPGTIISSNPDGCLTFTFRSDNSLTAAGWEATVTCSATPGTNTPVCTSTNCPGNCGQWVCADGLYPTDNQGSSSVEEITYQGGGCWQGAGEISTKWFYFTILNSGTIEITFDGPSGQDYDMALWGPSTNGEPECPINTGDSPIRCSYSGASNPVGMGNGATDLYEDGGGDGWVKALDGIAGETYVLALNIFQNGNPQPTIDITFGGTGTLDCTPVLLPISLVTFQGMSMGQRNLLSWITATEFNNDYFTVERSSNLLNWEQVGREIAVGNSQVKTYYEMYDPLPYDPVTYYRLKQTDIDGEHSYSEVIVVNRNKGLDGDLVSALFPNTANDFTSFTYNGDDFTTPMTVQIVSKLGIKVKEYTYNNLSSTQATSLRTYDIDPGVYNVIFTQGDKTAVQKVSIIR